MKVRPSSTLLHPGGGIPPGGRAAYYHAVATIRVAVESIRTQPQLLWTSRIPLFGSKIGITRFSTINRVLREKEKELGIAERHRFFFAKRFNRLIFGKVEEEKAVLDVDGEFGSRTIKCYVYVFPEEAVDTFDFTAPRQSNLLTAGYFYKNSVAILRKAMDVSFNDFMKMVLPFSTTRLLDNVDPRAKGLFLDKLLAVYFSLYGIEFVSQLDGFRKTFIEDDILLTRAHELGHARVQAKIDGLTLGNAQRENSQFEEIASDLHGPLAEIVKLGRSGEVEHAQRLLCRYIYKAWMMQRPYPFNRDVIQSIWACFPDGEIVRGVDFEQLEVQRQGLLERVYNEIRTHEPQWVIPADLSNQT